MGKITTKFQKIQTIIFYYKIIFRVIHLLSHGHLQLQLMINQQAIQQRTGATEVPLII